jgi:hypothetical protein
MGETMTITPKKRKWLIERLRNIAAEVEPDNERIAAEFRRVAADIVRGDERIAANLRRMIAAEVESGNSSRKKRKR